MKATCPNCQTSYRVADDKVPAQGAQIKCPKCQSTFVVRRDEAGDQASAAQQEQAARPDPLPPPPPPPPAPAAQPQPAAAAPDQPPPAAAIPDQPPPATPHDQATPMTDLMSEGAGARLPSPPPPPQPAPAGQPAPAASDPGSQTPNLDSLDGEAFISAVNEPVRERSKPRGVSAIRAQSATERDSLEGYRVRSAKGLTYDFPSLKAMMRWLAEREDVSGCQVAPPGGDWQALEAFLADQEKLPAVKLGAEPVAPAAERAPRRVADRIGGDREDPSKPIEVGRIQPLVPTTAGMPLPAGAARSEVFELPSGPRAGVLMWAVLVLGVLVVMAGAAATLTRYGIADLSSLLPLERIGIQFPDKGAHTDALVGAAPEPPVKVDPELGFKKSLGAGKRALRAKQFSKAALEFHRALGVHPGAVEALEGMAQAYAGLGDKPRALEALKQARKIKSQ